MILSCLHHARTGSPLLRQSCIRADHSCSFARCFNSALVILTPPQYNSSGTFRNVPLLLSHACPCAGWFDGYVLTTLLKRNNGFGEFTEPVVSYKPLLTRLSEAVLRLVRKGCQYCQPFLTSCRFHFHEFPFQGRVWQPCQTRFYILTFRQFCRKVSARRRHGGLGRAPASAFVIQMLCLRQRRHRRRWYLKGADNTPYEKIGDEVRSLADEVLFDIPDSWEWVRIRSLGEIVRGSGIKRNETVQQGLPCVRYGELYTTYQTSFTSAVSFIAPDLYEKCKHFSYGDVLMTLTGENKPDIVQQLFLSVHPDTPVRLIFSMIPYLGVWSQRNRRFSAGKFYAFRAALWRG